MIVVDTNVIGYRWIASPDSAAAEAALIKDPEWIAPLLWRSEFRNVLAMAVRRKTLTIEAAKEIARGSETAFQKREFAVSSDAVLEFAASSDCTTYDREFVALAHAEGVQLVTTDHQILHEFPNVAISLHAFVRQ